MQKALENCEQSLNTSLQMIHLAFLVLLLKNREQALRIAMSLRPNVQVPAYPVHWEKA